MEKFNMDRLVVLLQIIFEENIWYSVLKVLKLQQLFSQVRADL